MDECGQHNQPARYRKLNKNYFYTTVCRWWVLYRWKRRYGICSEARRWTKCVRAQCVHQSLVVDIKTKYSKKIKMNVISMNSFTAGNENETARDCHKLCCHWTLDTRIPRAHTYWLTVSLIRVQFDRAHMLEQFNRTKHIIMHMNKVRSGGDSVCRNVWRRPCITIMVIKLCEYKMMLLKWMD